MEQSDSVGEGDSIHPIGKPNRDRLDLVLRIVPILLSSGALVVSCLAYRNTQLFQRQKEVSDAEANCRIAQSNLARAWDVLTGSPVSHYISIDSMSPRLPDQQEAVNLAREAASLCPDQALDATFVQLAVLNSQQRFAEALRLAEEADMKFGRPPKLRAFRSLTLLKLGRDGEALGEIELALRDSPTAVDLNLIYGQLLMDAGRIGEAAQAYRAVIAVDPFCYSAQNNLGGILVSLGADAEALHVLDRACELDPSSAGALRNRSAALRGLGRHQEALADAQPG